MLCLWIVPRDVSSWGLAASKAGQRPHHATWTSPPCTAASIPWMKKDASLTAGRSEHGTREVSHQERRAALPCGKRRTEPSPCVETGPGEAYDG